MLLQVNDELVFEVPDNHVEKTLPIVKRVMEEAPHPAVQLHMRHAVESFAPPIIGMRRNDADVVTSVALCKS